MRDESGAERLSHQEHFDATLTARDSQGNAAGEAELRYQMLFDAAADAIFLIDIATLRIVDANRAACDLFGYEPSELVGLPVTEVSAEPEETGASIARGDAQVPRRLLKRRDGTQFIAEIYGSRLHYGRLTVRAAFVRDITRRVEAEKAQQLSSDKFAAAFAASPDAVNINRLSDGMYVEINEGFTRRTGFTPEMTLGKTSLELNLWERPEERAEMVRRLRENGRVDDFEASFRFRDGQSRPGLMSARIIDIGGVPHILSVTRDISELKRTANELERSNARLEEMVREITATLGRVVEIRDPYTFGHQERVASVSRAIAAEMGLSEAEVEAVEMAALVHDVGKLAVPAEILNKPGALSGVEFGLIKAHSERGHAILSGIGFPWPLADIVMQHHERQDGSGYPVGLAGDDILPEARILAIADVVEAMASHRPYRAALGLEAAVEEIRGLPQKFDTDARAACLRLFDRGALDFMRQAENAR